MKSRDHVDLDRLRLAAGKKEKERQYWLKKLAGEPVKSSFPAADKQVSPAEKSPGLVNFRFDEHFSPGLIKAGTGSDVRLHVILAAALTLLLAKYSGNDDILLGTPVLKSDGAEEPINTVLILRNRVTRHMTFKELLMQVRLTITEAYGHRNYPIELFLRHFNLPAPAPGESFPFFDTALLLENIHDKRYLDPVNPRVIFSFLRAGESIELHLEYDPLVYDRWWMERVAAHLDRLLRAVIADREIKIAEVDFLAEEERQQLLRDFNDTATDYLSDRTIHEIFAAQAELSPDKIALVSRVQAPGGLTDNTCLTYRCVNKKAVELAGALREKGVQPEVLVGIMGERSVAMIVGILGILQAGGAYLPIDPEYPPERIAYMLKDSSASILLTKEMMASYSPSSHLPVFRSSRPASLAYVIYTSGSTGKARGVMVMHQNVVRLVDNTHYVEFSGKTRILQTGALVFDASTFEIWGALLNGGVLVLVDNEVILKAHRLAHSLKEQDITTLWLSSPLFNRLMQQKDDIFPGLDYLLVGGDVLSPPSINKARSKHPGLKVVNGYGPTENTTFSATFLIDREYRDNIPIGKPIDNSTAYVVDGFGGLQPVGLVGELWVGGDGVARGYLNNPELTAERFVTIFNRSYRSYKSYITYRTGDRARWLPDGNLEFAGRIDNQVKIRGYRVEPGEVENCLTRHPRVKEVVVAVKAREGDNPDPYLCAYIVPEGRLALQELKQYAADRLPAYMIPAYFVPLERFPLTPNGKVDRKALPEPRLREFREDYIAPRDEVEEKLARIWSELLGMDKRLIGIADDFFELGGHSLRATTLAHHLYNEFAVNIEIQEIFTHPTIRELARRVKEMDRVAYRGVVPLEEREYYPLSYAQRRLWILCQFEEDSTAYNMPTAFILTGTFKVEAFTDAVRAVARRHESLRTVFIPVRGETFQKITRDFTFHPELADFRDLDPESKEEKTREAYLETANHAFDLEQGPLFLFKLVRWEERKYVLMYNIHHIVNDGWSQGVIINELITLYTVFAQGREAPLAPLQIQYKDYTGWHNGLIAGGGFDNAGQYWREKLRDKPNGIELPYDHPRKAIQTFNGGRVSFSIDRETTALLGKLSLEADATLFMGLLTLLGIFLYRISGQADLLIGAPIANRKHRELHSIVGFLVNTLVYRTRLEPQQSFRERLKAVKTEALDCYRYQDYPFDLLVEQLELDRDLSQSPLFNVMMAHNNTDTRDLHLEVEGIDISAYVHRREFNMSKFDLIFFMDEVNDEVNTCIEYNSDLWERSTIERMARNFLVLAAEVTSGSDVPVSCLNILSPGEYETVVNRFNDTAFLFEPLTLPALFERQVEHAGDKTALVGPAGPGSQEVVLITYRQLNQEANRLAHYLREEVEVKPKDIIGVSMERSIRMILVLLGIIKAGAAYLAVDPTYPRDRVLYMLANSRSQRLIIDRVRPELFAGYPGEILHIPGLWDTVSRESAENPVVVNQPADILYVNYTSGSTGTPNGALLSHELLGNLIRWQREKTSIDCSLCCLQFTSINFCVSFQEIMGTLTAGGKLVLIGELERQDIDYLMDFLSRHQIENLFLPFSYLNFLFNESSRWDRSFAHHLQHIITAGEQLKITSGLKRFLESNPHLKLHNHYGSTEMHVVTSYTLDAATAGQTPVPPAGKPISNTKIYILDPHLNPVPIGVWGELLVAGIAEVAGYINNPGLTDSKLVNHPVLPLGMNRHRLYRSGDIGRWLENGNIELGGRKDFMVKVRGFRVEPGEIESKILSSERVRECVVVVKEDPAGQKYLVAYLVKDDPAGDVNDIKRIIARDLPQYMIPQLVVLERLPLMPNGKVDRERLPETEFNPDQEYIAPRNRVEEKLVEIWSRLLGIGTTSISVAANFFELGGHSLKATTMIAEIHKEFNVKIKLLTVFEHPTIREIAAALGEAKKETFTGLENREKKEFYELSYNQKRLMVLHTLSPGSPAFNLGGSIAFAEKVDENSVKKVLAALVRRHESFRSYFEKVKGAFVQRIQPTAPGCAADKYLEILDLSGLRRQELEKTRLRYFFGERHRVFKLDAAPLFRVKLLKCGQNRFDLLFTMHHIISDGWSLELLEKEFFLLYQSYQKGKETENPLKPLRFQYIDYALWHNRLLADKKKMAAAKEFWKNQLKDEFPDLDLPYDYPGGSDPEASSSGKSAGFRLVVPETLTLQLRTMANHGNASLFMVLLTAFNLLLSALSGQEDIIVGVPGAARQHDDLKNIIGFFVNTLAVRNRVKQKESFTRFLDRVRENTLQVLEHQGFPLELICSEFKIKYPGISVFFNMSTFGDLHKTRLENQESLHSGEVQNAKFKMVCYITEFENAIEINTHYQVEWFKPLTIEKIMEQYLEILEAAAGKPGKANEEGKKKPGRINRDNKTI